MKSERLGGVRRAWALIYWQSPRLQSIRRRTRWLLYLNWEDSTIERRIALIYVYLWARRDSIIGSAPCVITDPRDIGEQGYWYNVVTNSWCRPDNVRHMACYER